MVFKLPHGSADLFAVDSKGVQSELSALAHRDLMRSGALGSKSFFELSYG